MEKVKAVKSEINKNMQGTNSDRKETGNQINGLDQKEERNIQPEQNEETRIQKNEERSCENRPAASEALWLRRNKFTQTTESCGGEGIPRPLSQGESASEHLSHSLKRSVSQPLP